MLKNIKLKNFATFVEPTTIDFSATNYKFLESENAGSNRILKGCIFVGENALGKTKILEAIKLLLNLTLYDGKVNFAKYKSFYSKSNSYELEYAFMIENNEIIYNMVISAEKIEEERLFLITHSTNVLNTTIIRPDQVYSLYFDKTTKIKRFSDEMPRESQNLEKMYLSGVFDGMPKYNK